MKLPNCFKIETLLNNLSNGLVGVSWPSAKIVYVNQTASDWLEIERPISENMNFLDFVADSSVNLLRPQNFESPRPIEIQLKNRPERTYRLSGVKAETEGTEQIFLLFLSDVTDQKKQREEIERTNARLQMVLDGANIGSWDWNLETNEVVFDRRWCEMLGLDPASTPQALKTWEDRVHADDKEQCFIDIKNYLDGKTQTYENIHRLKHAKGHWSWILDRGRISERDANGKPIRFSGIHFDLTDRKKQEEMILRSSKLASLGEMSAGIAHEINNPLSVIQMRCDLNLQKLQAGTFDASQLPLEFQKLVTNAKRISNIIRNLRGFAKRSTEEPLEEASIDQLIQDAVVLCKDRCAKHGIELENKNQLDTKIRCRPSAIIQAIVNLLLNAYDALSDSAEGWIRIETSHKHDAIEISVTDSGGGIPQEIQEKLFHPFFTTKEVGHGMGLGLSAAKGYIEENLGQLEYDHRSTNTRFVIRLPMHKTVAA